MNSTEIEKETKIYIPKISNPQILTYRSIGAEMTANSENVTSVVKMENDTEKRR